MFGEWNKGWRTISVEIDRLHTAIIRRWCGHCREASPREIAGPGR
jgi:hypothetical protein